MNVHPELRGGKVPRIALAAAALLSLTFESNQNQNVDRPTIKEISSQEVSLLPKPPARLRTGFIINYQFPLLNIDKNKQIVDHPKPIPTPVAVAVAAPAPPPQPLTPEQIAANEVTPTEYAEWSKVNQCEEGGNWYVYGSVYSGGLGISNINWVGYGGTFFAPNGAEATPDEQIVIASRIQSSPPDQNGCGSGW